MTEGLWAAIIGVCGTLFGTILGWLLNNLSNRGKLVLSVVEQEAEFYKPSYGTLMKCNISDAFHFVYQLKIDIYNTSTKTKFMREIKFCFIDAAGKILKSISPVDKDLKMNGKATEVQSINIAANSSISKTLYCEKYKSDKNNDNFSFIFDTENIFITYINEKGKNKRILIKKGNIKDYYKFQGELKSWKN